MTRTLPTPRQDDREESKGMVFDLIHTSTSMAAMAAEANTVIAMRTLGMMGFWPMSLGENTQMVLEKPAALAQATEEALRATFRGDRPDQVFGAALEPIRARTSDNAHRLTRKGIWERD